jgi:hypothetical protein
MISQLTAFAASADRVSPQQIRVENRSLAFKAANEALSFIDDPRLIHVAMDPKASVQLVPKSAKHAGVG